MVKEANELVGYVTVESSELLKLCIDRYKNSNNPLKLALNGTIPRDDLSNLHASLNVNDPKGLIHKFDTSKLIYIDSWSELLSISCVAFYCNYRTSYHWKVGIGIESKYRESSLREKLLGDGIVATDKLGKSGARQVFQECKAQNVKGPNSGRDIQTETIERINQKLANPKYKLVENKNGLLVSIFGKEGSTNSLDFKTIYDKTLGKDYESSEVFDAVFCVVYERSFKKIKIFRLDVPVESAEKFAQLALSIDLTKKIEAGNIVVS